MNIQIEIRGDDDWDSGYEILKIEQDEDSPSKVKISLSGKGSFDKKELLRAVKIMCEE
jgi:hypothetical protein